MLVFFTFTDPGFFLFPHPHFYVCLSRIYYFRIHRFPASIVKCFCLIARFPGSIVFRRLDELGKLDFFYVDKND